MDSVAESEALRNALMDLLGIAKQLRHEGISTDRIPDLFLATTVATLQSTAWQESPSGEYSLRRFAHELCRSLLSLINNRPSGLTPPG